MIKETDNVTDDAVSNILAFSKSGNAAGTRPVHLSGREVSSDTGNALYRNGPLESAERAVVLLIEELGPVLSCMTIKDIMFLAYLQGSHDPMAGILLQELKKC